MPMAMIVRSPGWTRKNGLSMLGDAMHTRMLLLTLSGAALLNLSGCLATDFFLNNTDEVDGNISLVVVNNTDSRAIFSFATWNDLDRRFTRLVNLQAARVPGNTTFGPQQIPCARNFAVATQDLVDWVLLTGEPDQGNFDGPALNALILFSDEPANAADADVPSAGTARGIELLVGVDYSCGDQIIVTLERDPDADGGFRADYEVILDENEDL
jgi:hypothetical protein